MPVKYGVPQGSVLGPYTIMKNQMTKSQENKYL